MRMDEDGEEKEGSLALGVSTRMQGGRGEAAVGLAGAAARVGCSRTQKRCEYGCRVAQSEMVEMQWFPFVVSMLMFCLGEKKGSCRGVSGRKAKGKEGDGSGDHRTRQGKERRRETVKPWTEGGEGCGGGGM